MRNSSEQVFDVIADRDWYSRVVMVSLYHERFRGQNRKNLVYWGYDILIIKTTLKKKISESGQDLLAENRRITKYEWRTLAKKPDEWTSRWELDMSQEMVISFISVLAKKPIDATKPWRQFEHSWAIALFRQEILFVISGVAYVNDTLYLVLYAGDHYNIPTFMCRATISNLRTLKAAVMYLWREGDQLLILVKAERDLCELDAIKWYWGTLSPATEGPSRPLWNSGNWHPVSDFSYHCIWERFGNSSYLTGREMLHDSGSDSHREASALSIALHARSNQKPRQTKSCHYSVMPGMGFVDDASRNTGTVLPIWLKLMKQRFAVLCKGLILN